MTVISNDGAGQVSKNVSSGVQQTAQMLKDTTGFDVIEMLKGFGNPTPAASTRGAGNGAVKEQAGPL
jgi:flotillin